MDNIFAKAAASTTAAFTSAVHHKNLQADDSQAAETEMRTRLSGTNTRECPNKLIKLFFYKYCCFRNHLKFKFKRYNKLRASLKKTLSNKARFKSNSKSNVTATWLRFHRKLSSPPRQQQRQHLKKQLRLKSWPLLQRAKPSTKTWQLKKLRARRTKSAS